METDLLCKTYSLVSGYKIQQSKAEYIFVVLFPSTPAMFVKQSYSSRYNCALILHVKTLGAIATITKKFNYIVTIYLSYKKLPIWFPLIEYNNYFWDFSICMSMVAIRGSI